MTRDDKGRFKPNTHKNLVNEKFGKLTVIKDTGEKRNKNIIWECLCECGNTTNVIANSLRSGNTKSCGCGQKERYDMHTHSNPTFINGTQVGLLNPNVTNSRNTSGFKGVSQIKRNGKYRAFIQFKRKMYWLGTYEDIQDAVNAREIAEDKLFGDFLKWYEEEKIRRSIKNEK